MGLHNPQYSRPYKAPETRRRGTHRNEGLVPSDTLTPSLFKGTPRTKRILVTPTQRFEHLSESRTQHGKEEEREEEEQQERRHRGRVRVLCEAGKVWEDRQV
ncbi:hypothetical protein E2C01_004357 [Portunus trituberculatus]|uniref:Uncharacterized protein n=1 Tax=Portunus trituberculatus TaxID=210409 RepID=A0A5B7CR62_PORTR|nr:hypothetical protein [Portunus trituberculatus]